MLYTLASSCRPIRSMKDVCNEPDEIKPYSSRLRAQQEDEALFPPLLVEGFDHLLPLFLRRRAIESKVGVSLCFAYFLYDVERDDKVGYDNHFLGCSVKQRM
jgi:hypothetical protein